MKKVKRNIPGGMALDVLVRLSRCLAAACVAADVDPQYDCYWTFDTHYGSTKPNEKVELTICVRTDRGDMVNRFYSALDSDLQRQYGLVCLLTSEEDYSSKITGSAYSLNQTALPCRWRHYKVQREEDVEFEIET